MFFSKRTKVDTTTDNNLHIQSIDHDSSSQTKIKDFWCAKNDMGACVWYRVKLLAKKRERRNKINYENTYYNKLDEWTKTIHGSMDT